MSIQVYSEVQTAKTLYDKKTSLVIPAYQRPYVWPSEQVSKLFSDIVSAYLAGEPSYYIGTVLTSSQKTDDVTSDKAITYELIDGQQRMTSLILLAMAFTKVVPESCISKLALLDGSPRLHFSIREQVQSLLSHWAGLQIDNKPSDEDINKNPYLSNLDSGYKAATQFIEELASSKESRRNDLAGIADYLFHNVKWVNNVMPQSMDLNKLFTTMNTSGIQLGQSDILKSNLLNKITVDKNRYDAIWQVCENMDNYFERNVRQLFPATNWAVIKSSNKLEEYSSTKFPLDSHKNDKNRDGLNITELFSLQDSPYDIGPSNSQPVNEDEGEGEDKVYCRSIISFSLLLLHTYRIYLYGGSKSDIEVRLNDIRLNECFASFVENSTEGEVVKFFECLWRVRYQFDRWVVKWVVQGDETEEHLRLSTVNISDGRLNRTITTTSKLSQLQSVRYFTGDRSAQYWLTPFLGKLVRSRFIKEQTEQALESIDNQLSLAQDTQKQASFELLSNDLKGVKSFSEIREYLVSHKGTGFKHYWFLKLEYVLWLQWKTLEGKSIFIPEKIKNYRITSKSSVEHVHPQNEESGLELVKNILDGFGNLVLLSPGENSSYSNQDVGKKKIDFDKKFPYDSLKLAHIFYTKADGKWDKDLISKHQKEMITFLEDHYSAKV